MVYFDTRSSHTYRRAVLPGRLRETVTSAVGRIARMLKQRARHHLHQRDIGKLRELPDYMLRDIGVNRSDIEHVVCLGDRFRQHSSGRQHSR
jgi:uncharacterized protein YjiS (DUF1127 family)